MSEQIMSALLPEQLALVAEADNPSELAVAGYIIESREVLLLFLGDGRALEVDLSCFQPSGTGLAPNFSDFEITDYGNTLRFGEYEASTVSAIAEGRSCEAMPRE